MRKICINNESNVPDCRIERIVKFYKLKNLPPISIHIRNSKKPFYASFYYTKNKIVIGIGCGSNFPTKITRSTEEIENGYASGFYIFSQEEALVYLLGHELKHAWQKNNRYANRKGRIKSIYSETDAEIFAIQHLNKWRELKCLAPLK